jgi:proline iminopeptidase
MLRGIFCLRKTELDWFYEGAGANMIFPEAWALFRDHIPAAERGSFIEAYHKRLSSPDHAVRVAAARVWSVWEGSTSRLFSGDTSKFDEDQFAIAFASIENHYFRNKGFFPRDGYLLEEEQVRKLAGIPTTIVQGRYDVVCPIETAYLLHQRLRHIADVDFVVVSDAGHSCTEPGISRGLVAAADRHALLK